MEATESMRTCAMCGGSVPGPGIETEGNCMMTINVRIMINAYPLHLALVPAVALRC